MIRQHLLEDDPSAMIELPRRWYMPEFRRNDEFVAAVTRSIDAARAAGWPEQSGAVWLVQQDCRLRGSLALTDEGGGVGRVRWFVLDSAVRGQGLGRSL